MKKENKFLKPELEIVEFYADDIILTSAKFNILDEESVEEQPKGLI